MAAHGLADPASARPKFAIIIIAIQIEFLFPVHHLHGLLSNYKISIISVNQYKLAVFCMSFVPFLVRKGVTYIRNAIASVIDRCCSKSIHN